MTVDDSDQGPVQLQDAVVETVDEQNITVAASLPDSTVAPAIDALRDTPSVRSVSVKREEQAIGILTGAYLTGGRGVLICQSSGLANAFNALGSLAVPWGVPFVGVVSQRGGLAEHNGAQTPAGYHMPRLLDIMGVRNHRLSRADDASTVIGGAAETAFSTEEPFIVLVDPEVIA